MATTPGLRGSGRKPTAPTADPGFRLARNLVGLAFLIIVLGIGFIEVRTNLSYNAAVSSLDKALQNESGGLLTREEAEKRIGVRPGGPGEDLGFEEKVTYRWRGLFRNYTLDAYYNKGNIPALKRIETP